MHYKYLVRAGHGAVRYLHRSGGRGGVPEMRTDRGARNEVHYLSNWYLAKARARAGPLVVPGMGYLRCLHLHAAAALAAAGNPPEAYLVVLPGVPCSDQPVLYLVRTLQRHRLP